jgi:hypothetical protein
MIILPIRERNGSILKGYIIQDWQDYNISVFGSERPSPRPEHAGHKVVWEALSRRSGKPVHYPCVYYKPQWETLKSFQQRIILEHPVLSLEQFVGL